MREKGNNNNREIRRHGMRGRSGKRKGRKTGTESNRERI